MLMDCRDTEKQIKYAQHMHFTQNDGTMQFQTVVLSKLNVIHSAVFAM